MKRWFILAGAMGVVALVVAYFAIIPKRIGVIVCGRGLDAMVESWKRDGSPRNFDVTKYIVHPGENYQVYTNTVEVSGERLQCIFAAKSPRFNNKGFMAITPEKKLIWVDQKGEGKWVR